MCNPLAAVAAVTAGSSIYAGRQQKKAAEYAADQQRQVANEQLAAQEREQAEQRRQFEEQKRMQEEEAARVREAEVRRQQNISQGQSIIDQMFGQFNDGFYQQRQQAYMDYAKPELERQYQDAMNGLVRSLSRSGNLSSSLRGQTMASLQDQYQRGLSSIANNASGYANQARSSIEGARGNLVSQNASLADPGTIRAIAESQAASLGAAQPFMPVGSLISALTRNAGQAAGVNKNAQNQGGIGLLSNSLTTNSGNIVG
jgi:hypothetical protein